MLPTYVSRGCLHAWTSLATSLAGSWNPLQDIWELSVSRENTHVLHQIGANVAAETDGVLGV